MNKILIDTNALLRFLIKDIPEQAESVRKLFQSAKHGKVAVIISPLIIFEVIFALFKFYKFPKSQVLKAIEVFLSSGYLVIEDKAILTHAINIYKVKNLDFVDCYLIAKAKTQNIEIFSFDKNLKKALQDN